MATLDSKITVDWGYRLCFVYGKKALFHKWVDGQLSPIRALIELEDGTVHEVYPHEFRFCDNLISQYAFPKEQEDK